MNSKMILSALSAVLLFVGCLSLPYGYYTFMRLAVFVAAIVIIVIRVSAGIDYKNIVLALLAILFNPIFLVHLGSKGAWVVIDLLAALWFVYMAVSEYRASNNTRK